MSKLCRMGVCFMIIGAIILCANSCRLFTSKEPEDYEFDPELFETEPNISVINENPVVTEPIIVIQETEPEIEPEATPLGNIFSASGTIKSDTNQLIKLHIDWKAYQIGDSEYVYLDLTVYLDCHAIMVGARKNSALTIDGEKIEFSTPQILNENNSSTSIELHKKTMEIYNPASEEKKSVEISAAFYFGGTYGGEAIGWVEVSGIIDFVDNGAPMPIPPNNDSIQEEPVTEEPVTEEPVTEEPVTEAPITEEPITEEPIIENPLTPELPDDPFEPVE